MSNWKHAVAGFCIPVNVFLAVVGILINDVYTVGLALACIGLVCLPLIQEYYEKEDEKENDSE